MTLNVEKCEFYKESITFHGHKMNNHGIQVEPEKMQVIREMKAPTTGPDLRHCMLMVIQLGKFTPSLTHLTQPFQALLTKDASGIQLRQTFSKVKEELSRPTTLALYNCQVRTIVAADTSSYRLGAVLLQELEGMKRLVAYASRSTIDTEALEITWVCERFASYILGKAIQIETKH